ncbi:hypothetical protein GCM10010168_93120 [Actinoplanes ianthinogenes]|nr:hypothetical protein [Actinoplanes ianthinogenes]GGR59657.1 hypothetical protein GCM10010168_93120 [Actinoplanes ianthinogenes]
MISFAKAPKTKAKVKGTVKVTATAYDTYLVPPPAVTGAPGVIPCG